MKIVFLDSDSLNRGDIDFSGLEFPGLEFVSWAHTTPDQVIERIAEAEIVISNKVVLDKQVLSSASHLKLICIAATGINNIDLEYATSNQIQVCNVTGYATPSVVQHVFALMTSLYSRLQEHHNAAMNGEWSNSQDFCVLDYTFSELAGKTIGIIGYGELGQAVAKIAQQFGMTVIVAQRPGSQSDVDAERVTMNELLQQADVITLHCPLAENTRYLINADRFHAMKPTAIIINTARGGIVNESDLLAALNSGELAGAALDVLEVEPPPQDHPLLSYKGNNLIITPHVAWASKESRQRLVDQLVLNIQSYFDGALRNQQF